MSTTPMTADQWRHQLKKFDVPFREIGNWDDPRSGRGDETGLQYGPVYGAGIHHTGNDGLDSMNRDLIRKGRSDLSGPLAQSGLNDDGVIDMITVGRANHFGGGDPDVLMAVRTENYKDYPPHTDKHQGEPGAVDGNDHFYGLETYYWKTLTKVQYRSMVGWAACICDFHQWTAKSVIGHKEWSDWKPDPNLIDMKVFRRDVDDRIDAVNNTRPEKPAGPKLLTPNISKAIRANIKYHKVLQDITSPQVTDDIPTMIAELKKQRRALREVERKA